MPKQKNSPPAGIDWSQWTDALAEVIRSLEDTDRPDSATIIRTRRDHGDEIASTLVSVASLQSKARAKFGDGVWWATERSLQQATAWQVAKLKSTWFADREVFDLCCGIGGDSIRLAERGPVIAVDKDCELTQMTKANLRLQPLASAVCADATSVPIDKEAFVHIDPDRRQDDRRTTRPDDYSPNWDNVIRIVDQCSGAAIKLAPAAQIDSASETAMHFPNSHPTRMHRTWISLRGSVREQSILCGETIELAAKAIHQRCFSIGRSPVGISAGNRSAISIALDGTAAFYVAPDAHHSLRTVSEPGRYLIDPDSSIRAAGLTEGFAAEHDLATLAGPPGFLTAGQIENASKLQRMSIVEQIVWSGSCDDRKLRRELRARDMYPCAIKVRGTDHDPVKLAKRYRECGDKPITLWIGRTEKRRFAAMTEPV